MTILSRLREYAQPATSTRWRSLRQVHRGAGCPRTAPDLLRGLLSHGSVRGSTARGRMGPSPAASRTLSHGTRSSHPSDKEVQSVAQGLRLPRRGGQAMTLTP